MFFLWRGLGSASTSNPPPTCLTRLLWAVVGRLQALLLLLHEAPRSREVRAREPVPSVGANPGLCPSVRMCCPLCLIWFRVEMDPSLPFTRGVLLHEGGRLQKESCRGVYSRLLGLT